MQQIFITQPLYAPLLPLLSALRVDDAPPTLDQLNALATARGIVTGGDKPLRFVVPHGSGMSYEERAWWLGEVETRPGNWHDGFNALVWLSFPRIKAALNQRHHQASAALRHVERGAQAMVSGTASSRGPQRDAATQFDECGAIVVSSDLELWAGIRAHRWKQVFWETRTRVREAMRVFVFGHATYDLLRQPHIGLCARTVFLHVDESWLRLGLAEQIADIDARIAVRFDGALNLYAQPCDFQPLPLLGVPGVASGSESPGYYEDTRQFRRLRVVRD